MEDEKNTQTPTIRDAVTYIIDKDGNEVKQDAGNDQKTDAETR